MMDARIKSGHDECVCVQYQSQFQTSRISTVIASEAKQSSFLSCCAMDCFASLAMTTKKHTFAISPHVSREVWPARFALFIRGRRECRAPDAPDSRVCNDSGRTHTR